MLPASRLNDAAFSGTYDINLRNRRMIMFGIILTHRDSPPTNRRPDVDRAAIFALRQRKLPEGLTESRRERQAAKMPLHMPRAFGSKSVSSRKADIARARRLLAAKLSYVAHPSFDDPNAHDAILASSAEFGTSASDPVRESRDFDANSSRGNRIPSREQEAHRFRKMNYLKCLACRIRDRINPDSPAPVDLDEVERLQIEALKLKNQIVENHLPLVISVASKRTTAGYDLCDRISDGTFALMTAVEHFDFDRGFRFSTYATWAIFNELTRQDRREWRRRKVFVPLVYEPLAAPDLEIEHKEAQAVCRTVVERLLRRLNRRERFIIVNRHGIGGAPEQTLTQIGLDMGISKERVRQLKERAHAKLQNFARLEAIEPAEF
jgi:RNA polymerase primary sigma factor